MASNMVKVYGRVLTTILTQASTNLTKNTAPVLTNGLMAVHTQGSGKTADSSATVPGKGLMAIVTLASLEMTKRTAMVLLSGLMEVHTQESTKTIKNMAVVSLNLLRATLIQEVG